MHLSAGTWFCRLVAVALYLVSVTDETGAARAVDRVIASTAQGQINGGRVEDVDYFMGIPYAAPPIGDLRWREPQAPAGWRGVRDATKPGFICPQPVRPNSIEPMSSEDCLFINVWRPSGAKADRKLPVMVWYHGGGMVFGSGGSTDGRHMARKGVIVVTLNYRLGHLGVFAHPALTAENPDGLTGNYTLMDAIASLKWVRSNIAGFGGDPNNVTIFGFSAGGQIVNTLMVMPSARGLFAKAITQSGLGRNYGHQGQNRMLPIRGRAVETGEKAGLAIAARLGVLGTGPDSLRALRKMPPEMFSITPSSLPGSMIDGVLLPETVATAYRNAHEAKVPQIIGRTICERCGVDTVIRHPEATFARAGALRGHAVSLYGGEGPAAAVEFASDLDHAEPARYLSRLHVRNRQAMWSYVFDYTPVFKRGEKIGPSHGEDMPYVFGTLRKADGHQPDATAADIEVSEHMMTYWTNFAKKSDPGTVGNVRWPSFKTSRQGTVMIFTNDGLKIDDHFATERLDLAKRINDNVQSKSYVMK